MSSGNGWEGRKRRRRGNGKKEKHEKYEEIIRECLVNEGKTE